jgi:hypothetical protein
MSSPYRLAQWWPILAGAAAGILAYGLAATIRPPSSATEQRLEAMEAEIHTLRDRLERVDAIAHQAGRMADDIRFSLEHPTDSE